MSSLSEWNVDKLWVSCFACSFALLPTTSACKDDCFHVLSAVRVNVIYRWQTLQPVKIWKDYRPAAYWSRIGGELPSYEENVDLLVVTISCTLCVFVHETSTRERQRLDPYVVLFNANSVLLWELGGCNNQFAESNWITNVVLYSWWRKKAGQRPNPWNVVHGTKTGYMLQSCANFRGLTNSLIAECFGFGQKKKKMKVFFFPKMLVLL